MNDFLNNLDEMTNIDLSDVRLSEINADIKRNQLEIILVCPESKDKMLIENTDKLRQAAEEILRTSFKIKLKIKKSYFDEAYFTYNLLGFLERYPIIKHNIRSGNFVFDYSDNIKLTLEVPTAIADYIIDRNIIGEIKKFIFNNYCEKIEVNVKPVELEDEEIKFEMPENKLVYDFDGGRKIKVSNIESFIGDPIYELPDYISDVSPGEGIILCGRIRDFIEHKRAKKEGETEQKYFFKFRLEDFTGSIDCIYFPTKKSLEQIRLLNDSKEVVCFGTVENNTFRDVTTLIFRVRFISLCTLPDNFVINRARLAVPEEYHIVHPAQYTGYEQGGMFNQKEHVPPFLIGKEFIVYDFETTGLNQATDKIIEIGALKLKDGIITETFCSLVDPQCIIPEKIVAITGITDSLVKGKPLIEDVMPDFYKFCYGYVMVGQNNVQFDWPFLRAKAEPFKIFFENEQIDVMLLAKKFYPMFTKYNLAYLAKQFGIVNESAHRALSDVITTAKVFIKLAENLN